MKKILAGVLFLFVMGGWLGGCAPLVVGTAVGLTVANHENHRNYCIYHYGNPWCQGRWVR